MADRRAPATTWGEEADRRGLSVGQIAGVEVRLDWSLLIIFGLIALTLGTGLFPAWHPEWSGTLITVTALAAAALFLASVLAHELSHALVGRRLGVPIRRITLFVFGGMAHLEAEPPTWRGELAMAIAGPLMSFALGFGFIWFANLLAGDITVDPEDPLATLSRLGPLATLLFWLGPVNIILAIFNLVPGFPLDGGRVLRAVLWGATGDRTRATRWAAGAGQAFGWLLIGMGFAMILGLRVPIFGSGPIGGLWIALIGWFLNNAAMMAAQRQRLESRLGAVPVARMMQRSFQCAAPDDRLDDLLEQRLLRTSQRGFPVQEGSELVGMICLDDLRRVPRERWGETRVAEVMTRTADLTLVGPDESAVDAMDVLARRGVNQLPVVQNGRLLGLVTRDDVLKWLAVHESSERPGRA